MSSNALNTVGASAASEFGSWSWFGYWYGSRCGLRFGFRSRFGIGAAAVAGLGGAALVVGLGMLARAPVQLLVPSCAFSAAVGVGCGTVVCKDVVYGVVECVWGGGRWGSGLLGCVVCSCVVCSCLAVRCVVAAQSFGVVGFGDFVCGGAVYGTMVSGG